MFKTYLLEVIKAIPPIKPRELSWVFDSPLFNKGGNSKEMAKLYRVIMDTAPHFAEEALQKERVYFKVFADKEVVPRKLDKLMSDLNKTLRLYLLAKNYLSNKNEDQQQLDWATWLRENGVVERSKQVVSKMKTVQEEILEESLSKFYLDLLIAQEDHERESMFNKAKGDLGIPILISKLDIYFYAYRISLLNRFSLQKKATSLSELENQNANLEVYVLQSRLLQIFVKINQVLNTKLPSAEDVMELVEKLKSSEEYMSFDSLTECYAFLRSLCTILINAGNLQFIPILHDLHLDNIENGFLLKNGEITASLYINLVVIANKAREFEWALKFTEEYKTQILGGDEDHFLYNFNKAQCLFSAGRYDEALDFLPQTASNSHYHSLVRLLELKIYYEQKSLLLSYKIDAFRKYIERTAPKTLASDYQTLHLNFLNILLQLSQTPFKDKARSALLLKRIEEKKLLSERAWLIEKAKELG